MLMPLAADAHQKETLLLAVRAVLLLNLLLGSLNDVGVEAAGQSTICRYDDEEDIRDLFALVKQWMDDRVQLILEPGNDFRQLVRVGARVEDVLLRTTQLGGRHHFHGARHLLGVFHRGDAAA